MKTLATDCRQAVQDFRLYVDGELPPDEAAALTAHLNACADCQAELNRRREMYDFLSRAYTTPGISGGFAAGAEAKMFTASAGAAAYADADEPVKPSMPPPTVTDAVLDEEDEPRRKPLVTLEGMLASMAAIAAVPWWFISGLFHSLLVVMAVLIGMQFMDTQPEETVIITELKKAPEPEKEKPKETQPFQPTVVVNVKDFIQANVPQVTVEETDVQDIVVADSDIQDAPDFGAEEGDDGLSEGTGMVGESLGLGAGLRGRPGMRGVPIGGGRRGMVGKIGKVSFQGQKLALVFDNSLSMKAVVEFAKEAVLDFLKKADGAGTIDFYCELNQKNAHELHELKAVPLRVSGEKVLGWFDGMPGGGGDRIGEAASSVWWGFDRALSEYPDMIIFVTDWKLHSPNREYNWQKQTALIEEAMEGHPDRKPVLVFFTQNGAGAQRKAMDDLAAKYKGEVHTIERKAKKK